MSKSDSTSIMFFKPTFEAIHQLTNMKNVKVEGVNGITEDNYLSVEGNNIYLHFRSEYTDAVDRIWMTTLPEYKLITASSHYLIPAGYNMPVGSLTMDKHCGVQDLIISITELTQPSIIDGHNHYWRFVYPVDKRPWFLQISALSYMDDSKCTYSSGLLSINFDGHKMHICFYMDGNQQYMIIESTDDIDYEEMEHRVLSLVTALGYVLGQRFGDFRFVLTSDNSDFKVITGIGLTHLQESRKANYKIFDTNRTIVLDMLSCYEYQQYAKDEIVGNDSISAWFSDNNRIGMDALSKICL